MGLRRVDGNARRNFGAIQLEGCIRKSICFSLRKSIPWREESYGCAFQLFDFNADVPEHRLRRGDIVKLVDYHMAPDGTE
jgi:hypothetical protein